MEIDTGMVISELRLEIKEVGKAIIVLKQEYIESKVSQAAQLCALERRIGDIVTSISKISDSMEKPKKLRSLIFTRVLTAILITLTIGAGAYLAEILYNTPSPTQQKLLRKLDRRMAKVQRVHRTDSSTK